MAKGDLAFSTEATVASALIFASGVGVGTGVGCRTLVGIGTIVGVGTVAGVVQATAMMPEISSINTKDRSRTFPTVVFTLLFYQSLATTMSYNREITEVPSE